MGSCTSKNKTNNKHDNMDDDKVFPQFHTYYFINRWNVVEGAAGIRIGMAIIF